MIKEYQINKTGEETLSGYSLPSGFTICVHSAFRDGKNFIITAKTCEATGKPSLSDSEKNLAGSDLRFPYDPSSDNRKSTNNLLSTHFEPLLDAWFGNGNWTAL